MREVDTGKELVAVAIGALRRNGYSISAAAVEDFVHEYEALAAKLAEVERENERMREHGVTMRKAADRFFEQARQSAVDLTAAQATITKLREESAPSAPFVFRRFINGEERAEGVTVTRAGTLEQAIPIAARLCSRRAGECAVLVYDGRQLPAPPSEKSA